jgi:hypothetical protein
MATHAPKADIRSDWIESRHRVDTCPSPERVPAARGAPKAEHRRGVGTIRPALHISRTAIVGSGQPHPIDIKLWSHAQNCYSLRETASGGKTRESE